MTSWDLTLLRWINLEWTHPVLDWLMPAVSAVNAWLPLFGVVLIGVIWRQRGRSARLIVGIALALALGDGVVSKTLKSTVGRVRPRDAMAGLMVRDLGAAKPEFKRLWQAPVQRLSAPSGQTRGSSFPSSHTINMFALATVVGLSHLRWGGALFVLAALVAYSRVYVAAHWPSDIMPSVGLGILVGWIVVQGLNRCWKSPVR